FTKYFADTNFQPVIQWFELGGELKVPELQSTSQRFQQLSRIQNLMDPTGRLGAPGSKVDLKDEAASAAAAELILEGLWAHRRIGRSEERGFYAEKQQRPPETRENP